jgi:hypothetical protein
MTQVVDLVGLHLAREPGAGRRGVLRAGMVVAMAAMLVIALRAGRHR